MTTRPEHSGGRASTKKFSVLIGGHRTSVSLEPDFADELRRICARAGEPVAAAIARIDRQRDPRQSLSSAIRVHVLRQLRLGAPSR